MPLLSSPNLTFLKIMPNVFSDTFQLIQAERYFLSFDLSVCWPEESTVPGNPVTCRSGITVFKCCQLVFGNGGKKQCMKMSRVHIMNVV